MRGRPGIARSAAAYLVACALLLHSLAMAAMVGPRLDAEASLVAQLQVVCSGNMTERPDLPPSSDHSRKAPACALCSSAHCGLAAPVITFAAPTNIVETLARGPVPDIAVRTARTRIAAQPRAPPAFA